MKRSASLLLLLAGCAGNENSDNKVEQPLTVGEQRTVDLNYQRFEVTNFEKRLDQNDLLGLPQDVRERLWLLDLDLVGGPNSPQLLDQSLGAIRALDPNSLGQAERNMQKLLQMTPDNADLTGTAIESLVDLAPLFGVASQQVLADMLQIDVEDAFLSDTVLANTIAAQVIATHPNAERRLGVKTSDNPNGVYPVSPGSLPVTLTDLATNFETFGTRFGPYNQAGRTHPGFVSAVQASVLTQDFAITVRANANALPFRGVDLSNASIASVSSIRSQIGDLFDFEDPNWMSVQGLVPGIPKIDSLTFRIDEYPQFVKGGLSPTPPGVGDSMAWQLPLWTVERILLGASVSAYDKLNSTIAYAPAGKTDPTFSATVVNGWQEITVAGGIGSPPEPSYVWDLLLEIAQVRLHDGGLKEGDANLEFSLRDVPLGTTTEDLTARVKANLRASPSSLLQLSETVLASTEGAADFYYYRTRPEDDASIQGDYLFFIVAGDIVDDDKGNPVRPYSYAHPGFYRDDQLTQKLSSTVPLDGDTEHEKVRLDDNPVVFAEDDQGAVYRISRSSKKSNNQISLQVQRIR